MTARMRRVLLWVLVVAGIWALAAVVQLWRVAGDLQAAQAGAEQAQDTLADGELEAAAQPLAAATADFSRAERRLGGVAVLPLRYVPVAARNLRVLRALSSSGAAAGEAGEALTGAVAQLPEGAATLIPRDGALPLDAYAQLVGPIRQADALLARSVRDLERTEGLEVIGRVDEARSTAQQILPGAAAAVHRVAVVLPVLDEFLGGAGPRRYLFVAQNPAEIRGTGGFIGAYSILTLDQGRFSFAEFDEIQALPAYPAGEVVPPSAEFAERYNQYGGAGFWHNINMTPDFPTAARAMENLYAKGTGEQVDGVIAVDPFALAALLEVAGPIEVPGFGTVTADEVVAIVSNRAHHEIRDSEVRKRLLGSVALQAFEGFLAQGGQEHAVAAVQTLVDVVRNGHMLLRSSDPDVQAALLAAGVAGALGDPPGDFVAVVANAGSAAKLDFYIDRTVDYDVRLHDDGSLTGTLTTRFTNDAPTAGISTRVIGPNARGLEAGEQRLVVSMYGPDDAEAQGFSRTRGDRPVLVDEELGHAVFDTVIEVPAGEQQTLTMSWQQPQGWSGTPNGGRYLLTLRGQPTLRPTTARVRIRPPADMVISGTPAAAEAHEDGSVTIEQTLDATWEIDVRVQPAASGPLERLRRWWSEPVLSKVFLTPR